MPKDESTTRVNSQSAGAELRQFVERMEHLDAEGAEIAEQKKEVMAELKGRGYDTKIFRKLLAERKRDPDDVSEELAVLDMYREALGMATSLSKAADTYDAGVDEELGEDDDTEEDMV